MQERFKAYNGSEPFVFVSYSHADSDRVYPIITKLHNEGYRIWYDEGIPPSDSWRAVINEHVFKCAVFMSFVSCESMKSREVISECTFAVNLNKRLHIVYLEDVPNHLIDYGIMAHFINNQRVNRNETTEAEFERKLREPLGPCKGAPAENIPQTLQNPEADDNSTYSVVLTSPGPNMMQVVKIIRFIAGLGLRESKEIIAKAPVVVASELSLEQAQSIVNEFADVEARAELRRD